MNRLAHYCKPDSLWLLGMALAVAVLSYFSLVFLPIPDVDRGLWLPGGVGVAALLLCGRNIWPGILAGTLVGYGAARGFPAASLLAMVAYACNALAPLACVWAFTQLRMHGLSFNPRLQVMRDVLLLGVGAGFGAAVAALAANTVLWLGGKGMPGLFLLDSLHWWMGDFLGIVLIAPALLIWQEKLPVLGEKFRIAEALACVALAFVCGQITFLGWFSASFGPYIHDEWLFIFAVWASVRFGRHVVAPIIAMISVQGALGISQGYGAHDATVLDLGYVDYWIYMIIYSLVSSALATAIFNLERTRTALGNERSLLRGVMDSIPDLIFFKDMNSNYLGCNRAFARSYQTTKDAIAGRSDLDLVNAERAELYRAQDAQVLVDRQQHFSEEMIHLPDGSYRLMEKLKTPYYDLKGNVVGIIGVLRDITRRDLSERREKVANIVLRHLASRSPLRPTLDAIIATLEEDEPKFRCSILLLDESEQHLLLGSAPSMPDTWRQPMQSMPLGSASTPYDIAVQAGERCICAAADAPEWASFGNIATRAAIAACWTEPIKSYCGGVLGVFSIHLREPAAPTEDDVQLLQLMSNLAAIAIERGRMEQSELMHRALFQTLETLLNALPIQIALVDENGYIRRINRLWKRFHVDHPAVMEAMGEGDNLLDKFPPVVGQSGRPVRVAAGVHNVLQGATAQYVCELMLERDDSAYWYQLAVVPVLVADATARSGAVIMLTDITQSRKTQESLHLREQEFKALAENSPDMVLRLNIDGRFLYANPAVGKIVGEDAAAIIGSTLEQVWSSAEVIAAWQGAIFSLFNSETSREQIEFDFEIAQGDSIRYYQAYLVPEYGSGRRSVISILAVIRDITNLKQAENRLLESQERLREMARSSAMLIERERKFIASELHDELGQLLTVLRMEVSMLKLTHGVQTPELADKADEMTVLLDDCIQGMRKAIAHMRPMALDLGLIPAIEWLCDDFTRRHEIPCMVSGLDECNVAQCPSCEDSCVRGSDGGIQLDDDRAIVVFRIVQESLTNIARHAAASRVQIQLSCDGRSFRVRVIDDGRGFDLAAVGGRGEKRFGLLGMQERAFSLGGTLEVTGRPGAGTTVALCIPNGDNSDCGLETMEETA